MFGSRTRPAVLLTIGLLASVLAGSLASPADGARKWPRRFPHIFKEYAEAKASSQPRVMGGRFVLQGTTTARVSKGRSITIPQPPGGAGDLMIASVTARLSGGGSITAPVGWTTVRLDSNIGGTALSQMLLYKAVTEFEPSSYTWSFSSSVGATGGISTFSGVDVQTPVDAHGGLYSANTQLIAAPSLTTSVDGALVLGLYGNSARGSMGAPQGMIEQFEVTAANSSNASTSASAR